MKTLPKFFESYFQLASQVHVYATRFAANEIWSEPQFKKPILNVQLNIKALNCGMRFRQTEERITSKVALSLLIN